MHEGKLCIGLISGTSADGVDGVLVRIAGAGSNVKMDLLGHAFVAYPAEIRRELFLVFEQAKGAVARLCSLNFVIGDILAETALEACRKTGVLTDAIYVIGSHGQTVWHEPPSGDLSPPTVPSTLQIGEPAVIAERTRCKVVADFHPADISAGGQGAPLVSYFDWAVLRHSENHRAIQNIGGIANVTYLPPDAGLEDVRAFDTGPGNMLIDGVVSLLTEGAADCDWDGEIAARGTVDQTLLARLMQDPFIQKPPPKTTGRERYGLSFSSSLIRETGLREGVLGTSGSASSEEKQQAMDLLATVTALTAQSVADAYRRWLPSVDEVIVSGGGAKNPTLMRNLREALAPSLVTSLDEHGIDSKAKEAMAMALLAHDALQGLATNVPGATGARRRVTLGKAVPVGPMA
jgi:anhydro-N-acetylmuramic acid kinase